MIYDMPTPQRSETDYIGMWYQARLRMGIDDRMWLGIFDTPELEGLNWYRISHRFYDGLGAFSLCFSARGIAHELPVHTRLPMPPLSKIAGQWCAQFFAASRFCRRKEPVANVRWRYLQQRQPDSGTGDAAPVVGLLSQEETLRIEQCARAAQVRVSVWLLAVADSVAREQLLQPDCVSSWVYPVNLRGAISLPEPEMNHCSGLMLTLPPQVSPLALARQVSRRFFRGEHWRQWWLLNLGRWLGQGGINMLMRVLARTPGRHTGSYSDLGNWQLPGITALCCSAPGSPAYPLAVATVLCNGRRSLSCRVHPVILADADSAAASARFVQRWRELAQQPCPGSGQLRPVAGV